MEKVEDGDLGWSIPKMFYEVILCIVCWPWMCTDDSYLASACGDSTLTICSFDVDDVDCGFDLGYTSNKLVIIDISSVVYVVNMISFFTFALVLGRRIGIALVLPSVVLWEHVLIYLQIGTRRGLHRCIYLDLLSVNEILDVMLEFHTP